MKIQGFSVSFGHQFISRNRSCSLPPSTKVLKGIDCDPSYGAKGPFSSNVKCQAKTLLQSTTLESACRWFESRDMFVNLRPFKGLFHICLWIFKIYDQILTVKFYTKSSSHIKG